MSINNANSNKSSPQGELLLYTIIFSHLLIANFSFKASCNTCEKFKLTSKAAALSQAG